MKQRLIIACIILSGFTPELFAQDSLSIRLLQLEQKRYAAENDTIRSRLSFEKMTLLLQSANFGEAGLTEAGRVSNTMLQDSVQADFLWNAALLAHLNHAPYQASNYLDRYLRLTNDQSAQAKILYYLIWQPRDPEKAVTLLDGLPANFDSLRCLSCIQQVADWELRHLKLYKISSAVLPGSGLMFNGNVWKGSVALALNGVLIYATIWLIQQQMYVNAALWGLGLWQKFYVGNIRLTDKQFHKREGRKKKKLAATCELQIKTLLERYPLAFR